MGSEDGSQAGSQAGGQEGRQDIDQHGGSTGRPGETEAERADRNFGELLQELRVAQTGVQILFGFLLTMPLQARFEKLDRWERGLLVADVCFLAVATACIIAPVAWHRVLFRHRMKDTVVTSTSRLAATGLVALGCGIVTSIALVLDLAAGRAFALWVAAGAAVLLLVLWLVSPVAVRARGADPA